MVYERQDRFAEAEALFKEALAQNEAIYGKDHYNISHSLGMLGILYQRWGKMDQAIDYYGRGLKLSQDLFPPHFPMTISRQIRMAEILAEAEQEGQAMEILRRTYDVSLDKHGPEYRHTKTAKERLIKLYRAQGKDALAEELMDRGTGQ